MMEGEKLFNFSVITLNTRGLRDYEKRRKIFNWLHKKVGSSGICYLLETHSDPVTAESWKYQWRGPVFFSHGRTDSCGVMTLVGTNLEFTTKTVIVDTKG